VLLEHLDGIFIERFLNINVDKNKKTLKRKNVTGIKSVKTFLHLQYASNSTYGPPVVRRCRHAALSVQSPGRNYRLWEIVLCRTVNSLRHPSVADALPTCLFACLCDTIRHQWC